MSARVMVRALVVVGLFTVQSADAGAQAVARAGANDDGAQIRQLWSTLDSLWNGRDAAGFSELFTPDASFVFVDRRQSLDGRAGILDFFSGQFPARAPELRHRTTVMGISDIAPGVHAVDGTVEILRVEPGTSAQPVVLRTFAIFAVMGRHADGWSISLLRIFAMPDGDAR